MKMFPITFFKFDIRSIYFNINLEVRTYGFDYAENEIVMLRVIGEEEKLVYRVP